MRLNLTVLLTVAVISACGDGALSPAAYFAEVERSAAAYDNATDAMLDDYTAAIGLASTEFEAKTAGADTPTLAEEKARLLDALASEMASFFERGAAALEVFVEALGELAPPAEIEPAHADAVAALTRSLDAIPALVAELRAAKTQDEIDAAVNGSAFGDAQPRVAAACVALEAHATARGIAADLRCGDTGSEAGAP